MGDMLEEIGNPPIMLLDLRPVSRPLLVIRSHEIAEQVSRQSKMWPYSAPKSDTMMYLTPLLGEKSIVMSQVRSSFACFTFVLFLQNMDAKIISQNMI